MLKIIIFAIDEIVKRNYNVFDTLLLRRTIMSILVNKCAHYENFVLSSGCDIPPESSFDNIDAFFKANDEFYK